MTKALIEDVGPWNGRHEFEFQPGINVLEAPNGSGKTIFLNSMRALARGEGKLPLRDGAKKGLVEGFGARITVGATTRHLQEFELENLEGKLSLSQLVDPGLKTPLAADRKRIEALVAITGTKASLETFAQHDAFKDTNFSSTVGTKAAGCSDLCEMADRIAKDYQKAARDAEEQAEKFANEAAGLCAGGQGIDLNGPCDDVALEAAYREALSEQGNLNGRMEQATKAAERHNNARRKMEEAKQGYAGPTVEEAESRRVAVSGIWHDATAERQNIEIKLKAAQEAEAVAAQQYHEAERILAEAKRVQELIATCEGIVSEASVPPVTVAQLTSAADKVTAAHQALLNGVRVRTAKANAEKAKQRRDDADIYRGMAEKLREAGKAVDQVLSESIKNKYLFVESVRVEKAGEVVYESRLMAKHPVRGNVPFDELSAGERWRIAIDLAADLVGKGGLIVIEQEGWEGIDAFERPKLHQHAIDRGVIIVTAEATRDVADGTVPRVVSFAQTVAA